ncbi:hypothetical protein FB451DRAFT_1366296 [Mycena latifolia]|nr:hypothetical protein FB451DRAFT_1366296 [Mycena latifolia]
MSPSRAAGIFLSPLNASHGAPPSSGPAPPNHPPTMQYDQVVAALGATPVALNEEDPKLLRPPGRLRSLTGAPDVLRAGPHPSTSLCRRLTVPWPLWIKINARVARPPFAWDAPDASGTIPARLSRPLESLDAALLTSPRHPATDSQIIILTPLLSQSFSLVVANSSPQCRGPISTRQNRPFICRFCIRLLQTVTCESGISLSNVLILLFYQSLPRFRL